MAQILYFAWLRERIGLDGETIDLAPGETAAMLAARLATRSGGHAEAFSDLSRVRCAIDQAMAPIDTTLDGAREIAYFPPVTGG